MHHKCAVCSQCGCEVAVPYPVSRRRRDVDGQSARELQDLDTEQQRHVGHLSYLLSDVLVLRGLLEVFGLCNLVHKSQEFPACAATSVPGKIRLIVRMY